VAPPILISLFQQLYNSHSHVYVGCETVLEFTDQLNQVKNF